MHVIMALLILGFWVFRLYRWSRWRAEARPPSTPVPTRPRPVVTEARIVAVEVNTWTVGPATVAATVTVIYEYWVQGASYRGRFVKRLFAPRRHLEETARVLANQHQGAGVVAIDYPPGKPQYGRLTRSPRPLGPTRGQRLGAAIAGVVILASAIGLLIAILAATGALEDPTPSGFHLPAWMATPHEITLRCWPERASSLARTQAALMPTLPPHISPLVIDCPATPSSAATPVPRATPGLGRAH